MAEFGFLGRIDSTCGRINSALERTGIVDIADMPLQNYRRVSYNVRYLLGLWCRMRG